MSIENAVLGSIMLDPDGMVYADRLSPDDFLSEQNAVIFRCIQMLYRHNRPIDTIMMCEALKRGGDLQRVGGEAHIGDLISCVPTSGHIDAYVDLVADASMRRRVDAALLGGKVNLESGADVQSVIADIQHAATSDHSESCMMVDEVLRETFKDMEAAMRGEETDAFIPSGFIDLDRKITGFIRGDVSVIGGIPSMGKSSLAIQAGMHAAISGKSVNIITMDAPAKAVGRRILSGLSHVGLQNIRDGKMTHEQSGRVSNAMNRIVEANLGIDTLPRPTIDRLRTAALKFKAKRGLDLLIVDYLQQISGGMGKRYEDVTAVSSGLKSLAAELDCALVAVSQLSRNAIGRRPIMSDLRESGQIEADAYLILFPYRPEVHTDSTDICDCSVCAARGLKIGEHAEVIIAKQKEGAAHVVVPVAWDGECASFGNLSQRGFDD